MFINIHNITNIVSIIINRKIIHWTKIHNSKVLEYHGKLKNPKLISSFDQLFGSKKTVFTNIRKVKNKNFSVISEHGIPC